MEIKHEFACGDKGFPITILYYNVTWDQKATKK